MKTYVGFRTNHDGNGHGDAVVMVLEPEKPPRPLNPRLDIRNHSPSGFEWGYGGSGPAQLALALAVDVLCNVERAITVYQQLKRSLVAGLEKEGWTLTEARLWTELTAIEQEQAVASRPHHGGSCSDCG